MTTTGPSLSLDRVGASLVTANDAIAVGADTHVVEDALVALCRASYDTLVAWELLTSDAPPPPLNEPETWRTSLDELRLQAALAEMELRDAGAPGLRAADRLVRSVTHRLAAGRREIGEALEALRNELRGVVP